LDLALFWPLSDMMWKASGLWVLPCLYSLGFIIETYLQFENDGYGKGSFTESGGFLLRLHDIAVLRCCSDYMAHHIIGCFIVVSVASFG
jgi:hypothetical protein